MVQDPVAGKLFKTTLPVGTVHVGCVTIPTTGAAGFANTVNVKVLKQPCEARVNVNVTVPGETPVTRPSVVTVAIAVLPLVHVPDVEGVTFAVVPSHVLVAPPTAGMVGISSMVTFAELLDVQLFEFLTVKV